LTLPVVVVLVLVWPGVWVQFRLTMELTGPVFSRPSAIQHAVAA
jgi:hypothetical protein